MLGFLFSGCQPELSVELPEEPSRLVVWGTLHPDSLATVFLSAAFSPLAAPQDTAYAVSDAVVELYENGQVVDTLQEAVPGVYRSSFFQPKAGKIYAVRALKMGYPTLQTRPDTMPENIDLAHLEAAYVLSVFNSEYGTATIKVTLANPLAHPKMIGTKVTYLRPAPTVPLGGWYKNAIIPCDNIPKFEIYDYNLEDYSCLNEIKEIYIHNPYAWQANLTHGVHCSIAVFSDQSLDLFEKMAIFHYYNTDAISTNPFYEPVFIPLEAEGGYGFVSCYNSIDTSVAF